MQVDSEAERVTGTGANTAPAAGVRAGAFVGASVWIDAVSALLQARWPSIDPARLDELASDLWHDERLRAKAPEQAARDWLEPVSGRR